MEMKVMHWGLSIALLTTAAPVAAQCGCAELRLAMDDNRAYRYRYYLLGSLDRTRVELRSHNEQVHQGRTSNTTFMPEAYDVVDAATGQRVSQRYDDRSYLRVPLAQLSRDSPIRVRIETIDVVTRQKMTLTLTLWGHEGEYNLLFDFAARGRYRFDLIELKGAGLHPGEVSDLARFETTSVASSTGMIQWLKLQRK